jgi:hypothetical protein
MSNYFAVYRRMPSWPKLSDRFVDRFSHHAEALTAARGVVRGILYECAPDGLLVRYWTFKRGLLISSGRQVRDNSGKLVMKHDDEED